jgi:hypothetical protein
MSNSKLQFTCCKFVLQCTLKEMSVAAIVKLHALYKIRIFSIMTTTAHRLVLFRVVWIQSTLFRFNYIRFALILLSHRSLVLLSGLFHSGLPTKTLYAFIFPVELHNPLMSSVLIILLNSGTQCKL